MKRFRNGRNEISMAGMKSESRENSLDGRYIMVEAPSSSGMSRKTRNITSRGSRAKRAKSRFFQNIILTVRYSSLLTLGNSYKPNARGVYAIYKSGDTRGEARVARVL